LVVAFRLLPSFSLPYGFGIRSFQRAADCLSLRATPIIETRTCPRTLNNAQIDNAQIDNAQIDNAQIDNAQIDNAQIDNAQIDNAQIDNAQIVNAQVRHRAASRQTTK
jgi:uncharacterized protein YjbI with pentapeptide repeats